MTTAEPPAQTPEQPPTAAQAPARPATGTPDETQTGTTPEAASGTPPENPTCFRHPKRETWVRCVRCDRYACPDCLRDAAVGQQCVECVREGNRSIRQARSVFGGRAGATPWVSYTIIGLCVLGYLLELAAPGIVDKLDALGTGLRAPGGKLFVDDGSGVPPGWTQIGIAHGEWYRLITAAFLHQPPGSGFGVLHIALNMWWVWTLGRRAEEMLGWARYAALYLLSALGSSVLVFLIAPSTGAIGASGAVFGLAASYWVFSRRLGHDMRAVNQQTLYVIVWLVVSAGFTSWQGHLGGFLTGGAIALAFAYAPKTRRVLVQAAAGSALLVLLLALVAIKSSTLT
ncbi:rhomboid family intramembrane serine protease [Actinomadura rupiterrae]|uniref:rhomboid family intramembrane serine protease n=1 Tax=Actinomadura rupiterrae TaxID=559627 RepID=UPI0020A4A46A|nr:rhomboid family intramembrane serine protease [Actinomadura rupiterrae]MCP2339948.1 membrane associated rhomboid family serine protease [Actinomadura rupiterrae]